MLEHGWHQGAGLMDYSQRDDLQLLVVITQPGDPLGENALWQMCAGLQQAGQPVIVLDSTQTESVWTPGLEHLLDDARLQPPAPDQGTADSVPVLPAAYGFERLQAQSLHGQAALTQLRPLLRGYRGVVLHGHTPLLQSPLLEQAPTLPMLYMPPTEAAMVECYRQVKMLSLYTELDALVVAPGHNESLRFRARGLLQSLQRCARRHLDFLPQTYMLHEGSMQELQNLGLQLLENAATIARTASLPPAGWTGAARPEAAGTFLPH